MRELCDESKQNNIRIIGEPKEEEREKWISKNDRIIRELFDQYKWNSMCIIGVKKKREKKG